jgi:hypothetical protein
MINLETHSYQREKPQGDSTNRKKDITILLPLSFICADCTCMGPCVRIHESESVVEVHEAKYTEAGLLVQSSRECTPSDLSTAISNLLQPAQAEVVLGQLSMYLVSWGEDMDIYLYVHLTVPCACTYTIAVHVPVCALIRLLQMQV